MADELFFNGSSEDATANIKRLVIEFASTLPADLWPNSYMASEVKGRWQYLADLDGRKGGRIVLEVTGNFLMSDEEKQAALSHLPEAIQTWDGNNWVATRPGVSGSAYHWKSLGEVEILRMNESRSRIINSMNSSGNDVWQYISNELNRMGLLVSLSTSATTTEQTLSAAATPHTQRTQDLIEHIQRHQTLLRQYEERRAVEDDPRRLLEIDLNIAREKEVLKGYEDELKRIGSSNK